MIGMGRQHDSGHTHTKEKRAAIIVVGTIPGHQDTASSTQTDTTCQLTQHVNLCGRGGVNDDLWTDCREQER